ncbi:MAG: S-adenosylmethionine decarboxylase [Flavobacteriales bacterium]|nr:S-adenosylmethionine decarboxylase [Flavobacteriales bacterium]
MKAELSREVGELGARPYRRGLHVVVDGEGLVAAPLHDMVGFKSMVEEQVAMLGLVSVGAVHHAFPNAGFTSVVCLTESHISIHTWPEHGRVTFDVFISNFERDNAQAVEALCNSIMQLMGQGNWTVQRLLR